MPVLVMPEEKVAVVLCIDFDVSVSLLALSGGSAKRYGEKGDYPACIFSSGPGGAPGNECTK